MDVPSQGTSISSRRLNEGLGSLSLSTLLTVGIAQIVTILQRSMSLPLKTWVDSLRATRYFLGLFGIADPIVESLGLSLQ